MGTNQHKNPTDPEVRSNKCTGTQIHDRCQMDPIPRQTAHSADSECAPVEEGKGALPMPSRGHLVTCRYTVVIQDRAFK